MKSSRRFSCLVHEFYVDLDQRNLLEEVDADSLQYLFHDDDNQMSWIPLVSYVSIASMACTAVSYKAGTHYGLLSSVAAFLPLVSYESTFFVLRRNLFQLSEELESSLTAARRLFSVLKKRTVAAFGLGIQSSEYNRYRLSVFCLIRSFVQQLSEYSQYIVDNYESLEEEKDNLFVNFHSDEMKELLTHVPSTSSVHLSDRGIGALLDLFVLHRSELARLSVLALLKSDSSVSFLKLLLFLRKVKASFVEFRQECERSCRVSKRVVKEVHNRQTVAPVRSMDNVVSLLDVIINSIEEEKAGPEEVRKALQRVLALPILNSKPIEQHRELSTEQVVVVEKERCDIVDGSIVTLPVVDQVFETVVDGTEQQEDDQTMNDVSDFCLQKPDDFMMGELKNILSERSNEYKARELKALASFYGVSEEEMLEREEKEQEKEQLKAEELHEGLGKGDPDGSPEWQQRPTRTLDSSTTALIQALAARRTATENFFGDDEDVLE